MSIDDLLRSLGEAGLDLPAARQFLQLGAPIGDALRAYTDEVKARNFPAPSHSFGIADAEKEAFLKWCRPDEPNGHGTNGHTGTNGHHTNFFNMNILN